MGKAPWRIGFSLMVAVTLLAAIVRFWHLNRLPPQAWDDEVWFASRARDMLQTGIMPAAYPPMGNSGNAGLVYLTALAQWLGVRSLVSARLSTAIAGVLGVPLAYACFREWLRGESLRRKALIALLAAILMAYLPSLVVLARIGMEPGLMPAVTLLVVWQMKIGLRRNSWIGWGVAGLAVGLSQYLGLHFRFLLPLVVYIIGDRFLFQQGKLNPLSAEFWCTARRSIVSGALVMVVVAALACLPLIGTFMAHPGWLTDRAMSVTQNTWGGTSLENAVAVGENAMRVLGAFFFQGDAGARHNPPGSPMLDPVQAAGFLAGIGWGLRAARHSPLARILLVWLALMALPSILADYPPNFERMIGVTPAVAGLAALGWARLYNWFSTINSRWVVQRLGPVLLLFSMVWDLFLVFGHWANAPELRTQFTTIPYEITRELVSRSADEQVYVERIPITPDPILFEFLFEGTPARRVNFHECLPLVNQLDTPASYVVLSSKDSVTLDKLSGIYPQGTLLAHNLNLWQEGSMAVLDVPAGAIVSLPEYHPVARFDSGISLYGYDFVCEQPCLHSGRVYPGGVLKVAIYWSVERPVGADLTSFVHVIPAGVYDQPPVAQHDGPLCAPLYPTSQWHPGEIVLTWFEILLPADLAPGKYEIDAGWYDPVTSVRTSIVEADEPLPDGRAIIGHLQIETP